MRTAKFNLYFSALACGALLLAAPVIAADIAGSKDPAFMQRFSGSEIVDSLSKPYLQYTLGLDDSFKKTQVIEGQVTRTVYRVPGQHTIIEIIRNYEQSLAAKGFHTVYEVPFGGHIYSNNYFGAAYPQSWQPMVPYAKTLVDYFNMVEVGGVIEKGAIDGHDVTVVVSARDYRDGHDEYFVDRKKPVRFNKGEIAVVVDVVTSTAMQSNMVTVKAADIADALATKGVIDLYGVYFDTDKTDVKPESSATLDEVASLLKIDRSLKLEVSGHTDNSGAKDHNMALSQGRAQAVVKELVSKYGIDAKRLTAKGYGDTKPVMPNTSDANKAKNRRVELRKM